MKLSIVVPVYNVAEYLPRCVDSLLAQQLDDCEIILVDDGSTDGLCDAICDRYAAAHPGLVTALHKSNGGLGDARHFGLQAAHGEYVLFVDSDDYLDPTAVKTLMPYIRQDYDVVIFGFRVDTDGQIGPPQLDDLPMETPLTLSETPMLLMAAPSAWNKVWRRSLFTQHDIRYPARVWYEDLSTTGKLFACASSLVAIPVPLYYYVVREGSITRNRGTERNREIMDALNSVTDWYREHGLYESYRTELEALTVFHVFMTASVRVARIDPHSPVLKELRAYVYERFPAWRKNSYVKNYPPKHRLVLLLLRLRAYRLTGLLFNLKGS